MHILRVATRKLDSVNKNFCLAPDVKMVRPKDVANNLKNQFGTSTYVSKH